MSHVEIEAALLLQAKLLKMQYALFFGSSIAAAEEWKLITTKRIQQTDSVSPEVLNAMIQQFASFSDEVITALKASPSDHQG